MVETLQAQDTDLQYYRELLRKSGNKNDYLEETLPENPDFDQRHDISNGTSSCRLDKIPEEEELLYPENGILEQNPYFIADTQPAPGIPENGWDDGRKGHEVRNIGVWNEHGEIPPVSETYYEGLNIAERLRDVTAEQIGEGYMVVGGSMQTFKHDLHFVASDLETEEGAKSDLPSLKDWFLYEVDDGEAVEPLEYQSREKIGDYLEELLV